MHVVMYTGGTLDILNHHFLGGGKVRSVSGGCVCVCVGGGGCWPVREVVHSIYYHSEEAKGQGSLLHLFCTVIILYCNTSTW